MLCSNCSTEVSPVAVFDIDGTMGDYHGQLIDYAAKYLGREPHHELSMYDGSGNFGDWIMDAFDLNGRKEYRDIKLAFRQGGSKRWMEPYPDMIEAARFAKEALGCELWLATTRPYLRLDSVDPDTREWLRRHEVPFDHLMYDENKYRVLAERIDKDRIVVVVDDLPEMYDAAALWLGRDGKHPAILRANKYNRSQKREHTIYEGNSLKKILRERVVEWKEQFVGV